MNRAIDYEISRQVLLHSRGQSDQIVQETRLWEEGAQVVIFLLVRNSISISCTCNFLYLIVTFSVCRKLLQ